MFKISIFGTGYVGLVNCVGFADKGHEVICVDVDAPKIERLRQAKVPFYEPQLQELLRRHLASGRLRFTTVAAEAVKNADIIFIAVGTPSQADGSADLGQVFQAVDDIAQNLKTGQIIVVKSTVPVGTCAQLKERIAKAIVRRDSRLEFDLVFCPEFLSEGSAVHDNFFPNRIIVGVDSNKNLPILRELFTSFLNGKELVVMDMLSSEMSKYAANAMLATRISFMNELSRLCEKTGADIESVRLGLIGDPRIGPEFLKAGLGYGGSCLPKDIRALIHMGLSHNEDLHLLQAVEKTNGRQKMIFFEKIRSHFGGQLENRQIAFWGVAFKPGTDDVREASAVTLMEWLSKAGAQVRAFDPMAEQGKWNTDQYKVLEGAEALVVATEWESFYFPDFTRMKAALRHPVIFDGRNIYSPKEMRQQGFVYEAVGRPNPR